MITNVETSVLDCCGFHGIEDFGALHENDINNDYNIWRWLQKTNFPPRGAFIQIVLRINQEDAISLAKKLGFKCLTTRHPFYNSNSGNKLHIYVMDYQEFLLKKRTEWNETYLQLSKAEKPKKTKNPFA